MSPPRGRSPPPPPFDDDSSILPTRQIESFTRTAVTTASSLIASPFSNNDGAPGHEHFRSALRLSKRPMIQRSVFSFAKANPRELIRSNFNTSEIEHRALTYLPDELLRNMPESSSPFSLFEGFRASLPEGDSPPRRGKRGHGRHGSKSGQKLLEGVEEERSGPPKLQKVRREKDRLEHRLEMMGIRKTMCASEIREIDNKITNLNTMRKVILDRLAGLEEEERDIDLELGEVLEKFEVLQEQIADEAAMAAKASPALEPVAEENLAEENEGFMSESIYGQLPKAAAVPATPPKTKRRKMPRRVSSMPVLHEHMEPGSRIRELQAHNDVITALDFDVPFGVAVTAALDDTVRVWDLNAGRCMGLLEGHLSSVRCLQVEESLCATGSMDASIRLWDLSQADYNPQAQAPTLVEEEREDADDLFEESEQSQAPQTPAPAPEQSGDAMKDCHMYTLSAHVAEITALNFRGSTLVSGSADKTLRQWDLEKGRCVQTLDVLWAAAQAASQVNPSSSSSNNPSIATGGSGDSGGWWRPTGGRLQSAESDFIGALQVFETALACGTADGMVRLWDLRSGMVHRSLVGHTGPVTSLQFDDVYLVTGSRDRSIRIWDLRTGNIHDAFAYDAPITAMQFDARRIVAAAGEDVVKVYDKTDGRQWDCGAGVSWSEGGGGVKPAVVERVKIRDGYMIEGRRDGVVGVWSC